MHRPSGELEHGRSSWRNTPESGGWGRSSAGTIAGTLAPGDARHRPSLSLSRPGNSLSFSESRQTLRNPHLPPSRDIPQLERQDLFKRRRTNQAATAAKRKICLWKHTFVCLAKTGTSTPPTAFEKVELLAVDLGPKTITVMENAESWEFHDKVLAAFPKLHDGGGYELLRSVEHSNRELRVIPCPPGGYVFEERCVSGKIVRVAHSM